jgi:DNA polymerase
MPLRYGAAHTHRLGGDWQLNVQNFPSRGVVNHLKCALMAWLGYKVVNTDSSQIEARIVAWLCGEWDLLNQFRLGQDPYKIFAAKVFHVDVSQVTAEQRFLGKTSILGLGFGLGWVKFKHQVRVKSLEAVKLTGKGQELILQDQQSMLIVNTYRGTYTGVPAMWKALNNAISILAGGPGSFSLGPCVFFKGRISLPNGLWLYYHNLRQTTDGWVYDHAGKPRRLYGGALLENIVQALARCIVMDASTRIAARLKATGWGFIQLALQVHDALAYLVPDALVEQVKTIMREEMNRPVDWALDLPLACDIKSGQTYGDAK